MSTAEQSAHDGRPDNPEALNQGRPDITVQTAAMRQIAAVLESWMRRECSTVEGAAERLGTAPARLVHMREGRFELLSLDELAEMLGRACAASYRKRS